MGPRTLKASVLVLLLLQPGWRMLAGECIADEDLVEATACCKMDRFIPTDKTQKCFEQVSTEHAPDDGNFMICLLNCTYGGMGLITESGVVDPEKYMPYLAPLEPSFRAVVASAVINCAKATDDILRDTRELVVSCNVFPLMFHLCVTQYTIDNCPAERFTTSPVCNLVKAGAPSC